MVETYDIDELDQDFQPEAMPFVIYNPEKRLFEINDDTLVWLKKLEGPIGVISVAGMYRTGKSYLLNRVLLNQSRGFDVGPTINACTKGVWIWGKPINGFTPEGDPIKILVLDTEGLGALDEDSNHDVRIFSLAILLASYFLYNSMGSIDENALQQLSLVVNLTKHIQIKSGSASEECDPEDFAQYFPAFMWIVRDFSLQLVDAENEPINQKEYLEKALGNQKGFSEGVEAKNRIRRMLKSFFKERDCCTMIRPLTNEGMLQNLAEMELDQLRPEFTDQVMSLRRKVINRIKPKTMNGKKLNGEMLYNLAHSYVDAINKGAVPSIESSWSYICKNQCQKAVEESFEIFERHFNENFLKNAPMYDDELNQLFKEAKRETMLTFDKVAVGDVKQEFSTILKDKMQGKLRTKRIENEKICEQECGIFLNHNFGPIEAKLRAQEYGSLYELTDEMKDFQQYFYDHGPAGTNRQTILQEFCYKSLAEACEFFFKGLLNEVNLQKELGEQAAKKMKSELLELKDEKRKELEGIEGKLRTAEIERAEISAHMQSTREQLKIIQQDKERAENEAQEALDEQKKDFNRQLAQATQKVTEAETTCKDVQRRQMANDSEYEKNKALFEQKIEHYQTMLEEHKTREAEQQAELKQQKRDFMSSNKEHIQKNETLVRELNAQVQQQKDQLFDKDSKLEDMEAQLEQEMSKATELERSLRTELAKLKTTHDSVSGEHAKLKEKYNSEIATQSQEKMQDEEAAQERIAELENYAQSQVEELELAKNKWEKDEAIYKQRLEFQEVQLSQERQKQEEQRKNHEGMMRNLANNQRESVIGKDEVQKQLAVLKEEFNKQQQIFQENHDQQISQKDADLDLANKNVQELSFKLQQVQTEANQELQNLREQLQSAEQERDHHSSQSRALEKKKINLMESAAEQHANQIEELRNELEQKDETHEQTLQDIHTKSEEAINALKQFYEEQGTRMDERMREETGRAQKRYNGLTEEFEAKMRDERTNFEDQIQMLEEEAHHAGMEKDAITNHYEHELGLKLQEIEQLTKFLNDNKSQLNDIQLRHQQQLDQEQEKYIQDRKELTKKAERTAAELTRKDRQLTTLENNVEALNSQAQQKANMIETLKAELQQEKSEASSKFSHYKAKLDESEDNATQNRIDFERERALKDQQIEFQNQRVVDLTAQLEKTQVHFEERIASERDEHQKESREKIERLAIEKQAIEVKYEAKRKALKETEGRFAKANGEFEREKAVLILKAQNLENQQEQRANTYEIEIERLRDINEQLQINFEGDKATQSGELDRFRREAADLERNLQDQVNNYDKDKCLWQGKHEFLEQQRDQAKRDLEEAQTNFQRTVESLQKSQSDSKSKADHNHTSAIMGLETKYQVRMKEINDQHAITHQELTAKLKGLEKDRNLLTEKLELANRDQISESGNLGKKLEKATEQCGRLQDELDAVKEDRDKKYRDYQQKLEKEREQYGTKKREADLRVQRTETKQTELLLTHERERAKWSQAKTDLIHQKEDYKSENERLKMKVDSLYKEQAQLRQDLKTQRKAGPYAGAVQGSLMTKLAAGGYKPGYRAGMNAEQPEGGATDRSSGYTGRFGLSKGDGVSASMDLSQNKFMSGFASGLQSKVGNMGGINQSTTALNKQTGLSLNLKSLQEQHDTVSQNKNLLSTPSSKSGEVEDQTRFSLGGAEEEK